MSWANGIECTTPSGCPLAGEARPDKRGQLCDPAPERWEELRSTPEGLLQASYIGPCIQNRSRHDALTGLDTYKTMTEKIESRFRHPSRRTEILVNESGGTYSSVTIGFADGNNFGDINNEYDHVVGDLVLCSMADMLVALTRESDLRSRRSGDEFAFALFGLAREEARTAVRRIRQGFSEGGQVLIGPATQERLHWTAGVVGVYMHNPSSAAEVEEGFRYADFQLGEWKKTERRLPPPLLLDYPAAA